MRSNLPVHTHVARLSSKKLNFTSIQLQLGTSAPEHSLHLWAIDNTRAR
jgi:hypothetical protein